MSADIKVGDRVVASGVAVRVVDGVGVLVELFSKTDQYQGWVRESDVRPAQRPDLPEEPGDGTWLDISGDTWTVLRRDDTEGHCDQPERRYDRHWWDYTAAEWIDWPAAVERGAETGRRLVEQGGAA